LRQELRNWLLDFIDSSREGYLSLPLSEKKITFFPDCQPPCQIEVFWLREPEYQIVYFNRDLNREDKEIIINGPYENELFLDEVEFILKEARWIRLLPQQIFELYKKRGGNVATYADLFERVLRAMSRSIQESVLRKARPGWRHITHTLSLDSDDTVLLVRHNITILNSAEVASCYVQRSIGTNKERDQWYKEWQEEKARLEYIYGSCFYPAIMIGKKLKKSFRMRITRLGELGKDIFPEKVFDISFDGIPVIAYSDGLIGVKTDDKTQALKILNLIFSYASAADLESSPVTESEVVRVGVFPNSLKIDFQTFWSEREKIPAWSPRANALDIHRQQEAYYERKVEPIAKIRNLILQAAKLSSNKELSEQAVFWNAGRSHHKSREYAQSFIQDWIVIEKYVYRILEDLRNQKIISNNKYNELKDWHINSVLILLNLSGQLNDNHYSELNRLRKARNDFIHSGIEINEDDSNRCLKSATKIIKDDISTMLNT
jgi:hypothetical protein